MNVDATHVLVWEPAFLTTTGLGCWSLMARADYDAGSVGGAYDAAPLPQDTDPRLLADWAGRQLGYPVALAGARRAGKRQLWRRNPTVPVWYVIPAAAV